MAQAGLLEWSNAIRFTMANDSGRQLFHDQIQHGFLFLDDYLDNILFGAKQDPLIELVKTPGRKKAISKKPKTTSKLNDVVSLSLEDDGDGKENSAPVNNFHKALLKVKNKNQEPAAPLQTLKANDREEFTALDNIRAMELRESQLHEGISLEEKTSHFVSMFAPHPEALEPNPPLAPPHVDPIELSMIAEDDETPERSRISIQFPHQNSHEGSISLSALVLPTIQENQRTQEDLPTPADFSHRDSSHTINSTTSSSATFYPIPLGSPQSPQHQASETPAKESRSPSLMAAHSHSPPAARLKSLEVLKQSLNSHTTPSLELSPSQPSNIHDSTSATTLSAGPPAVPSSRITQDIDAPLGDPDAEPTSLKGLDRKSSVVLFPTLPAPLPLRKSMRVPHEPSLGAATPGAAVGGKRTSWLMKAREVKAMENISKKTSVVDTGMGVSIPSMPSTSGSLKRKSGDGLVGSTITGLEDEERRYKSAKYLDSDIAPLKPKMHDSLKGKEKEETFVDSAIEHKPSPQPLQTENIEQEGMLNRFKRTVEGLGARVGKSIGKSLGATAAANALAEARAAAEARIAERNNKEDELTMTTGVPISHIPATVSRSSGTPTSQPEREDKVPEPEPEPKDMDRRLSVSDLFLPNNGSAEVNMKAQEKVFQLAPNAQLHSKDHNKARESATMTPPDSPPATRPPSFTIPSEPVFNKPPPVFIPPIPASKLLPPTAYQKESAFSLQPTTTFSVPILMSLGFAPRLPSPSSHQPKRPPPLSAQSTLESVKSDFVFDDQGDAPAWMPNTQDTEYSSQFGSQSQTEKRLNELDEDDSWPIDEKLAGGVQWTFGVSKEDSMTWSTAHSQSQRADTGPVEEQVKENQAEVHQANSGIPGAFDVEINDDVYEKDTELAIGDSDLEEIVMGAGPSTVSLIETTRSQSQMSIASSASSQSQSQVGFLGQASKLLSSALGTSKKGNPEVKKVLQMAAVAAKKQQEENDKKAARLKEMENRRQLAMQRKVEEEKMRTQEQERKLKEEGERRKRDREENTEKRPLKPAASKKDDDNTKKRKLVVETDKKPEIKKPTTNLNTAKTTLKSSMKQPTALSSSATYNSLQTAAPSTSTAKLIDPKTSKSTTPAIKSKGKEPAKAPIPEDDISQPSQIIQSQMAARAKAQLQAAKGPVIASESIELPDINSEYSDSEDEDRPKTFDPPDWAQSPELRQALQMQSTINPDEIFGAIRPLRMEEIFKTRTSRFRARTSSANWAGADRLTVEEERDYARRMGFR